MDIKSVKQLAVLMKDYDLRRLEVREGELVVSMTREDAVPCPAPRPESAAAAGAPEPVSAPPASPAPEETGRAAGEALCAPLVGVAYLAPKPGSAPFVSVGQKVKQGQTLCILEAIKVMNEFPAPRDGVVTAICVENEDLVEFGQCLFRLQ